MMRRRTFFHSYKYTVFWVERISLDEIGVYHPDYKKNLFWSVGTLLYESDFSTIYQFVRISKNSLRINRDNH